MKVYHAYRTTEDMAFEPIGAYPDCSSEHEVLQRLKKEGKWNRRHYFMIDHFDPSQEKGPDSFNLGDGMVRDALFGENDTAVEIVAAAFASGAP
jgi:hypothetical protein